MRTAPTATIATIGAAVALFGVIASSSAHAAERVNIPAISTASWQQADKTGGAIVTSSRKDIYNGGATSSAPPSSIDVSTTRLVSRPGAASFSREVRAGSSINTGREFASLRLLEAQGIKGGASSLANPAPGSWLTANLARAALRGTPQARLIPASLPGTTAITGVTGPLLPGAASTAFRAPMVEIVRAAFKVPATMEPSDGLVTVGAAGSPMRGFLAGTTQYQWSKASFSLLNGDQCRDGQFYLVVDERGLMTAFSGQMICADMASSSGAEYRFTTEKRVASYLVKEADVPGAPSPSVTWASLQR